MKTRWPVLIGLFFALGTGWAQNPPALPDAPRPPSPTGPTAPTRKVRDTARVLGRIFPSYGNTKLPDLITLTLSSLNSGFFKVVMVQGASFEFKDVPPGRYQIRVESVGYEKVEKEIEVEPLGRGGAEFVSIALGPPEKNADDVQPGSGPAVVEASALTVPAKALREMGKASEASSKGDSRKAVRHLLRAVELHPDYHEAFNNLAVQYTKLGQPDDAVEALEKSVGIHPTARAYLNLGIIHYQSKRPGDAIAALIHATELDPSDDTAVRALAEVYFKIGQYVLASQRYWQLAHMKNDPSARLSLGYCYHRLNLREHAKRQFEAYLAAVPNGEQADRLRVLLAKPKDPKQ